MILSTYTLAVIKTIELKNELNNDLQVISLDNIPPRFSFIIGFKQNNEIWEIPYSDQGGRYI